ncbi:MAG: 50S ribosomal protein L4 [Erysipelotrichia bacterium]|nr:50S ribosomal protein L4 [Candidatus Riflebacteria bacterium]NCB37905.1 50S ribosomal protein L4 [Erysipelotrichia bacterium]
METKIFKMNGTAGGSVNLDDRVFACKAHPQTINDVVKAQLNNERHGTVFTRTRGEISGTTKKMFKQKGTGRARQGDIKSPLHLGGGTVFGPKPRIFDQRPPKKVVDRAIVGVLTELVSNGNIRVVEGLEFSTGKTKDVATFMESHKLNKVLFVVPEISDNTRRAVSNIKNVKVVTPMHVNVVDLLKYGNVAINDKAVKMLEEVLVK